MKNNLMHFAIHTDKIERAKSFYEEVFEWGFNSYGPSDFLQIKSNNSDEAELIGALQSRKYSQLKENIIGFECTISVENVDEIQKKIETHGGKIVMPKTAIPHVGWVLKFLDTEGNLVCAMETDSEAK